MPEIADILVAFGRIDELVGEHRDNPAVIEVAERLLPGTTGFNQGWFSQVERLFQEVAQVRTGLPIGELPTLPTFAQSLNNLATRPLAEETEFSAPQLAKARYAAAVLTELNLAIGGPDADPALLPTSPDTLAGILGHSGSEPRATLGYALAAFIEAEHPSNEGWYQFMDAAFAAKLIEDPDEVRIAPYKRGELRMVGDEICTQLDTPFPDDELTIDKVASVLDPLNWKPCGAPYWESVQLATGAPNAAGWTRIHETVRPDPRILDVSLTTALMYRTQRIPNGVIVNYDLDVDRNGSKHDGFVLVDQGYIMAKKRDPNHPKGIRVHTRKVARIQGLGVAAMAMYAYTLGWSTVGENLILGCARNNLGQYAFKDLAVATAATPNRNRVPGIPEIKAEDRQKLIKKAVDAATSTVTRRSKKASDLVQKWLDGDLKPGDLDLLTGGLGADLAEASGASKALVAFDDVKKVT